MKSIVRVVLSFVLLLVVVGGVIWGFYANRGEQAADADDDAPVQAPSRMSSAAGQTLLSFDDNAQKANGIRTTVLVATRHRPRTQATGVVVQLQPLLDLKASYNTPRTDLLRTTANARASEQEYQRLKELNQDGKNASDKSVETARAASENDAALVDNAQQALTVLHANAVLRWGSVVTGWMERNSPEFEALLNQRSFLLQVTNTAGGPARTPTQATVQLPDDTRTEARFISVVPQLDPRLQTASALYVIPGHAGLVPGLNLSVFLPGHELQSGVMLPMAAVVWYQGTAWCYVETSSGKFDRVAVDTSNPTENGWFVTKGLDPGVRVVTAGAQTLLSEEFRSQIQADND